MCFTISIGLSALSSSRSKRLRASFSHLAINKLRQCFWMLKLCTHFYAYFPRHSFFCAHKYIVFEFSEIKKLEWTFFDMYISYSFLHLICSHLIIYNQTIFPRNKQMNSIIIKDLNLGQRKKACFFQSISNQCQIYFPICNFALKDERNNIVLMSYSWHICKFNAFFAKP